MGDALQVFLAVLFFGGFILILSILFKNIFAPKKIAALRNLIKAENYKQAILLAKDILIKDKNNTEAHFILGESYFQQKKYELALIEFKIAEKAGVYENFDEKKLRERLGELFSRFNELDEALKEYILLTNKFSKEHTYYYLAGELFEKKENDAQALKYYSDCVKIYGNYVPALLKLGIMMYKAKRQSEASSYLQSVISKEPENYEAFYYLGMISKADSNYKNAVKYFEKAAKSPELKVRALMEKGMAFIMQKSYDEAIIELNRALKNCLEENNVKINLRYLLANCYELNRNVTEAINLWEQIYAVNPKFKDVSEKLSSYQEIRIDDRMKDFLTATDVDFVDMCKGIIFHMGLNIMEQEVLSKDLMEFQCLDADNKWRNMKKHPKIIMISRSGSPVEESVMRQLNDKMRDKQILKGIVITSSGFTKGALAFVKERPIELIEKNALQDLLKKASL
jgi:tetratricopeptide (TPR) repeat protein